MKRPTTEELIATWAHRPGDLSPTERREVEALVKRSPEAQRDADEDRAVVAKVARLPGGAPDWYALEQSIRAACDDAASELVPHRTRWRTAAGVGVGAGLAAAAAVALWLASRSHPAPAIATATPPPIADLAGGLPGLDDVDEPALDRLLQALDDGLPADPDDEDDDVAALDDDADLRDWTAPPPPADELLPAADLGWVDDLDDAELDALNRWLDDQPT